MRQGPVDVAEVDLEDPPAAEVLDGGEHVPPHQVAPLQPAADAEADADVGAVGDLHRLLVAVEAGEDAPRHAAEIGHRGVVGVDADEHPRLLGHGPDLPRPVLEVGPHLLLGELAAVGQGQPVAPAAPGAGLGAVQVEAAGRGAAAGGLALRAPDAVAHVGVGRVRDAGAAEVPDVALVLLDLGVAAGQPEDDGVLVVDVAVAEAVDLDAGLAEEVAAAGVVVVARVGGVGPADDVLHAHAAHEVQVLRSRLGRHLGGDLQARLDAVDGVAGHGRLSPRRT